MKYQKVYFEYEGVNYIAYVRHELLEQFFQETSVFRRFELCDYLINQSTEPLIKNRQGVESDSLLDSFLQGQDVEII